MTSTPQTSAAPRGRLLNVAPGMPTTDMARTVEHYGRLGFTFGAPGEEDPADAGFAIGEREGVALHFAVKPEHDPARTAMWVYVSVESADAMAEELKAAGMAQGREAHDTDYRMREIAHIDPDGNLILFGSPMQQKDAGSNISATASSPAAAAHPRELPADDPTAVELIAVLERGDLDRLVELLAADPGLAASRIDSLPPLHIYANAPGHRPNPVGVVNALVAAGADIDAHAMDTWHHETALHWAASNDDVELIDALLDAGADIEHPGSSINGEGPIGSALGYAQWAAARRLRDRGARASIGVAGGLGEIALIRQYIEADPAPSAEDISVAFWNACRAGQLEAAQYLLDHGAQLDWPAPWSGETPLDIARHAHRDEIAAWLVGRGVSTGTDGTADAATSTSSGTEESSGTAAGPAQPE
jgi:uncharacterized protein